MKISEAPLDVRLLCKERGNVGSNLVEITKERLSDNGRAAYIRMRHTIAPHDTDGWYDLGRIDELCEIIDTAGVGEQEKENDG